MLANAAMFCLKTVLVCFVSGVMEPYIHNIPFGVAQHANLLQKYFQFNKTLNSLLAPAIRCLLYFSVF